MTGTDGYPLHQGDHDPLADYPLGTQYSQQGGIDPYLIDHYVQAGIPLDVDLTNSQKDGLLAMHLLHALI